MADYLGIRVRKKTVAFFLECPFQDSGIFNYTVVYYSKYASFAEMRVSVFCRWLTVSCPSCVTDTAKRKKRGRYSLFEL